MVQSLCVTSLAFGKIKFMHYLRLLCFIHSSLLSPSLIFQLGWRRFFLGFQFTVWVRVLMHLMCMIYNNLNILVKWWMLKPHADTYMRLYTVKGNSWYSYRHRTSFIFHIQHWQEEKEWWRRKIIRKTETETENSILLWNTTWVHIRAFWLWSLTERETKRTQCSTALPEKCLYVSLTRACICSNAWNTRLNPNTHTEHNKYVSICSAIIPHTQLWSNGF